MSQLAASIGSLPNDDELFALLQANVKDYAIFVLDVHGQVVRWNRGAEQMFGYQTDEILGRHFALLFTAEDNTQGRPQRELQIAMGQGRADDENWLVRKDGRRLWAVGSTTALWDEDGQLRAFAKIVHDVTERRAAEQALHQSYSLLHAVVEGTDDAVFVKDREGRYSLVNAAAAAVLGRPAAEILGHDDSQLFPLAVAQPLMETDRMVMLSEQAHTVEEVVPINGQTHIFLVTKAPYYTAQGEVIGLIGIARDITERAELEQRKDAFISLASHELRTPVTSLKGFTQILQRRAEKRGDADYQPILVKMEQQVDRVTRLIDEILDVARIQQGHLEYQRTVFPIDLFVKEVVDDVQQTADQHQILIVGETGQDVVADRDRLAQVLINVLANAIKYSPEATTVTVRLSYDRSAVTVSVQDFGIGIPPEEQKKVFERFYRTPRTQNQRIPGLGLGLYIAREIVERLGGRIWIESTVGQGSTVSFTVPRASADPTKTIS